MAASRAARSLRHCCTSGAASTQRAGIRWVSSYRSRAAVNSPFARSSAASRHSATASSRCHPAFVGCCSARTGLMRKVSPNALAAIASQVVLQPLEVEDIRRPEPPLHLLGNSPNQVRTLPSKREGHRKPSWNRAGGLERRAPWGAPVFERGGAGAPFQRMSADCLPAGGGPSARVRGGPTGTEHEPTRPDDGQPTAAFLWPRFSSRCPTSLVGKRVRHIQSRSPTRRSPSRQPGHHRRSRERLQNNPR